MNPTPETVCVRPADAIPEDNILDKIIAFLRRFVFLRDDSTYLLIAAWILSTYLTDIFDYTSYLFVYSPERQCGKSRLLELLSELVCRSSGVLISPTEAVLFRTARNCTQIFDEVD